MYGESTQLVTATIDAVRTLIDVPCMAIVEANDIFIRKQIEQYINTVTITKERLVPKFLKMRVVKQIMVKGDGDGVGNINGASAGTDAGAGANAGTNAGAGANAGAGTNTGAGANISAGADAGANIGANTNANTSASVGAGVSANTDANANVSASVSANTNTGANINAGANTNINTGTNAGAGDGDGDVAASRDGNVVTTNVNTYDIEDEFVQLCDIDTEQTHITISRVMFEKYFTYIDSNDCVKIKENMKSIMPENFDDELADVYSVETFQVLRELEVSNEDGVKKTIVYSDIYKPPENLMTLKQVDFGLKYSLTENRSNGKVRALLHSEADNRQRSMSINIKFSNDYRTNNSYQHNSS